VGVATLRRDEAAVHWLNLAAKLAQHHLARQSAFLRIPGQTPGQASLD
jgi:hypothetical protein